MLSFGLEEQRAQLATGGETFCAGSRVASMPVVLGGVASAGIAADRNGVDPVLSPIGP
jgi:hypothetical protein